MDEHTQRNTQTQHLQPLTLDTNAAKSGMTDKPSATYPDLSTKHIHLPHFTDLSM